MKSFEITFNSMFGTEFIPFFRTGQNVLQRSCGMASKGLRATFLSTVTKFGVDYQASKTIETLISYTVCCA